ncbi:aspartyl protease family protein [Candidatus Venteria ishoeyi]|uniref:PDZ domain-containing protein n=1 Tax=Candidatus Venteria ishoeyi TaxID=1899563 RepID=A0A1H6FGU4_9GAMM|nr:aspartyl protease family protein [Candidatus Venteria ishoeyi]MDM8546692.1 aspartyl protease family protein [Candidatus Venteria ishoeyi]SEH08579.1 Uncharacterised protein [Candidatus Venteria ishoeyi]
MIQKYLTRLVLFILLFSTTVSATEPVFEHQFITHSNGIFVPVQLQGKEYLFLLDSGSTLVVLDESLKPLLGEKLALEAVAKQLGSTVDKLKAKTPTGEIDLDYYPASPMQLGKLEIANPYPYSTLDLESLWPFVGIEFHGLLGSAFLHQYRWELDFEKHRIRAFSAKEKPPAFAADVTLPIRWSARKRPQVPVELLGSKLAFVLDTGDLGTGQMRQLLIGQLKQQNLIASKKSSEVVTLNGRSETRDIRLKNLKLGTLAYQNLVFSETEENALGIGFLRRHHVLLDFPNLQIRLKKCEHCEQRDEANKSGMRLVAHHDKLWVFDVKPGTAASQADIKASDQLLQVNAKSVTTKDLFWVRRQLRGKTGSPFQLQLQRGEDIKLVNFVLDADPLP